MKGKHQRSQIHKANDRAAQRIAELEAEVEHLKAIDNVAQRHIEALGEIERLTRRVLFLDGVERERDRLTRMLEHANARAAEAEQELESRQEIHAKVVEIALESAPAGLTNRQRLDWLLHRLGHSGRIVKSPHLRKLINTGGVPTALVNRIDGN